MTIYRNLTMEEKLDEKNIQLLQSKIIFSGNTEIKFFSNST